MNNEIHLIRKHPIPLRCFKRRTFLSFLKRNRFKAWSKHDASGIVRRSKPLTYIQFKTSKMCAHKQFRFTVSPRSWQMGIRFWTI